MSSTELSDNALTVLRERYLAKNDAGIVTETPSELWERVAREIAQVEALYGGTPEDTQHVSGQFTALLASRRFLPNSPTLMNAGREGAHKQYSACFVIPVDDDMQSIGNAVTAALLIHKSGGGTGFSFSNIRPKGDRVRSSGGIASGPVSFMKIIDSATEQIRQGGTRRGANMGILHVTHPDIVEFISCKTKDGHIRNFNISVAVTDEFMHAVREDRSYALINPRTQQPVRQLPARMVLNRIVEEAWKTGDPGLFFIDRANGCCPIPKLGPIVATNPCGEQPLHAWDACLAGETLVLTTAGLVRIDELSATKAFDVVTITDSGATVVVPDCSVISQGVHHTIEVTLKGGQRIRCTPDHKILTSQGWREAGSLQPRSLVRIQNVAGRQPEIGESLIDEMLGWFLGDGWLTQEDSAGILFSEPDQEAFTRLKHVWDTFVQKQCKVRTSRDNVRYIAVYRRSSVRKFLDLGFKLARGIDKELPTYVFTASTHRQLAFLRGLFSADGGVSAAGGGHRRHQVCLSSSSRRLLEQVQVLLMSFGIQSRVDWHHFKTVTRNPQGRIVLTGDDAIRYWELIGFIQSRHRLRTELMLRHHTQEAFREVRSIRPMASTAVFDVVMPIHHKFFANGIVAHNCTLGSIDLAKHVSRNSSTGEPVIDWSDLKESVWWAVRFLDNVIDANDHPLPQINERTRETRRIGLGIMGHARLLMELGIAYDSEEGLRLTQDLSEGLRRMAWEASEALAESRGVYPAWHGSEHEKSGHRVRNSYVTTVAPTGTISMIADTSAGCEPEFALVWYKNVLEGKRLPYICNPFFRVGQQEGWWHPGLIDDIVSNHGSCRGLAAIPKRCQEVFGIAHDIAPEWHVRMQAAWQHFSDTAVSKTINLPESATVADVRTAYQLAWELDCSGITVYRDGSRADQVLNLGAIEHQAPPPAPMKPSGALTELPDVLDAKRIRITTPDGHVYVTISVKEAIPQEVFIHTPVDAKYAEIYESFARIFSTALRFGIPADALLEQLEKANQRYGSVASIPAAIVRAFHMSQLTNPAMDQQTLCPKCEQRLLRQENCLVCASCGWSKCS